MKMYYHKTDGGAEYLMDNFVVCPNGEKEGVLEGSAYVVRIDGDIKKDAELTGCGCSQRDALLDKLKEIVKLSIFKGTHQRREIDNLIEEVEGK